jgi:hypothetical protein
MPVRSLDGGSILEEGQGGIGLRRETTLDESPNSILSYASSWRKLSSLSSVMPLKRTMREGKGGSLGGRSQWVAGSFPE